MTARHAAGVDARLLLSDDFADARPEGTVVGSAAPGGARRHGVDAEHLIGIDNGALRLRPLARPGWGREGVAYGPYDRRPGLALAVLANNGHNASQTYFMPESRKERVRRWLRDARKGRFRRKRHHENFAVGWFSSPVPDAPLAAGNGFVMHAATADNGELWAGVRGGPMPALLGVQNIPILYVVVLREQGAAYYAATLPDAPGLGAFPALAPLAVDPSGDAAQVWAGVQQRILGEVGYRVDTRVYGVRVAEVPEWSSWYGPARAADRLVGEGPLAGSPAEAGGAWQGAGFTRTATGARSGGAEAVATVDAGVPAGLVHALVRAAGSGTAGVAFRAEGDTCWAFCVGLEGSVLRRRTGDGWETVASSDRWRARPGVEHSVQVLDTGAAFGCHLDGDLVFGRRFDDRWGSGAPAAGVVATAGFAGEVARFEAHDGAVEAPAALAMVPPSVPAGTTDVVVEDFAGPAGDLAAGPGDAGVAWERSEGAGVFERTGTGDARVVATRERPNPGRTIYTTAWPEPGCAHLAVELTQPGPAHGAGGRGGVVLWQDEDNYLVVNLFVDETFAGASISTFYHLGGKEVMWDAVWTLVRGVSWETRNVLEVRFDGRRFLAVCDGRPSLYRELTDVYPDTPPLEVRRVGLIANWEWGDDTGTVFHRFAGWAGPAADQPDGRRG